MSDVRTILGPLFPDVTFTDTDQAFVERHAVPVGPAGSDARTAVEGIWPDETFVDDDVLVIETSRKAMTDVVSLPGELTSDDFDGAAGAAPDPTIWTSVTRVTLDGNGHAIMPIDDVSANAAMRLANIDPVQGKAVVVEWAQISAPGNGYNITGLQIRNANNPNYYAQLRQSGGVILWKVYAYGGTQQYTKYDPVAHRLWRIRVEDQVYFEASPDGQTWTTLGTAPVASWMAGPCTYNVTSGPWDPRGVSATPNLLERFSLA